MLIMFMDASYVAFLSFVAASYVVRLRFTPPKFINQNYIYSTLSPHFYILARSYKFQKRSPISSGTLVLKVGVVWSTRITAAPLSYFEIRFFHNYYFRKIYFCNITFYKLYFRIITFIGFIVTSIH